MKKLLSILIISLLLVGCSIAPPKNDLSPVTPIKLPVQNVTNTGNMTETQKPIKSLVYFSFDGTGETFKNALSFMEYDLNIDIVNVPYEETDKMLLRLMAGDDSFDFFYLPIFRVREVIEQGYYVELSQYEEINALFSEMNSSVKVDLSYNDNIFGFPEGGVNFDVLPYDLDKLNSLDRNIEDIKTIDDLIQLDKDWIAAGNPSGSCVAISEYDFDAHYISMPIYSALNTDTRHIDFSSIDFETIIEKRNILLNRNMIVQGTDIAKLKNKDTLIYKDKFSLGSGTDYIFYPSILSDQPNTSYYIIGFYMINPYSKNIDETIEFFIALGESLKDSSDWVYKSSYSLYKDMELYTGNNESVDKSQTELAEDFFDNGSMYFSFKEYRELSPILEMMKKDEISIEDGVAQMQKIIDLVSEEYTLNYIED